MKKLNNLIVHCASSIVHQSKTLTLLLVMLMSVNMWGDTHTATFGSKGTYKGYSTSTNTATVNNVTWTLGGGYSSSYVANDDGFLHVGSGNKAIATVTLSTSNIGGTISSIVVNAKNSSSTTTTLSVTVGESNFKCDGNNSVDLSTTAKDYEFTGSASGTIVVTASQSSAKKAIYIASITVTYSTSQKTNVNVSAEANGSIKAYSDANYSSEIAISNNKISVDQNSTVYFKATPNTGYVVDSWTGATANPSDNTKASLEVGTTEATVSVSFKAPASHDIYWYANGQQVAKNNQQEGTELTIPTDPDPATYCDGKAFVGWTATSAVATDGTGITYVKAGDKVGSTTAYYAVFADKSLSETETQKEPKFVLTNPSSLPSLWTTNANEGSSYLKMEAGEYVQNMDLKTAGILADGEILSSAMSVVVSCGTFQSWSTPKSVKVTVDLLDASSKVLTTNNATFTNLGSSEGAEKSAISVALPTDPTQFAGIKITVSDFNSGTTLRFKNVNLTYKVKTITYSNYTTTCALTYEATVADGITNGSVVISKTDDAAASAASLTGLHEGDKVYIFPTANTGYNIESVSVNGTPISAQSGKYSYTIGEAGITVSATFVPATYQISYNRDGGNWTGAEGVDSYTYGTGATLPTADDITKANNTFLGWYVTNPAEIVTSIGATETGDKSFTASWLPNGARDVAYSGGAQLNYISNPSNVGKDDASLTVTYSVNKGYTISAVAVTVDGSALTESEVVFNDEQLIITPTAGFTGNVSITFTVVEKMFTVTWMANKKEFKKEQIQEGSKVILPTTNPADEDGDDGTYKFQGWFTEEQYSNETTAPTYITNNTIEPEGDVTYYAVYAIVTPGPVSNDYAKITATTDLVEDGQYIIASNSKALNSDVYKEHYMTATGVTISNNKITNTNAKLVWTIEDIDGGDVLFKSNDNGNYLQIIEDGTYHNLIAKNNDATNASKSYFTPSVSNGNWTLEAYSVDGYYVGYKSGSSYTEFTAVNSSSNLQLYKRQVNPDTYKNYRTRVAIIDYIAVNGTPAETNFVAGETFDATGLSIDVYYKDEDTPTNVTEGFTFAPTGALKTTDDNITFSYQGKTADVAISVSNTVSGIEVTTDPTKMEYTEGQQFDPAGMVVTATYDNSAERDVTGYDYEPKGDLALGNKITISFGGQTKDLAITINEATKTTVKWYVNGVELTEGEQSTAVIPGKKITALPSEPEACQGNQFVGWTAVDANYYNATTAPTDLFKTLAEVPTIGETETNFYAVFASEAVGTYDEKVTLTSLTAPTADKFTYAFAKLPSGTSNPSWNAEQAKTYVKNTLTVTSKNNRVITKIEYTYNINSGGSGTAPTGATVIGNNSDNGSWDATNKTWTSSTNAATTVTLTVNGSAGNYGFTAIKVYLTGGTVLSDYSTTCLAALANPTITTPEGEYCGSVDVEITQPDGNPGGAKIMYSTNNTDWSEYTAAVNITTSGTVYAKVVKAPKETEVVSATYTVYPAYTLAQAAAAASATGQIACLTFTDLLVQARSQNEAFLKASDGQIVLLSKSSHGLNMGDKLVADNAHLNFIKSHDLLQLTSMEGIEKNGTGTPVADEKTITEITSANYGQLVKIMNVTYDATNKKFTDASSKEIAIDAKFFVSGNLPSSWPDGGKFNATGVVVLDNNSNAVIAPRNTDDLESLATPLDAPTNFVVTSVNSYRASYSWTAVDNNVGYTLYIYDGDEQIYKSNTIAKTATEYAPQKDLVAGHPYTAKLVALGDKAEHSDSPAAEVEFTTNPNAKLNWYVGGSFYRTTDASQEKVVTPEDPESPCATNYENFVTWCAQEIEGQTTSIKTLPTVKAGDAAASQAGSAKEYNFYAVFGKVKTPGTDKYVKVTEPQDNWKGEYLIGYDEGDDKDALTVFNGNLTTLDATNNNKTVSFETDGSIAANETNNSYRFIIEKSATEGCYTIQSASGYYIGGTVNSNTLNSNISTKYDNSISWNNGVEIKSGEGLCFNEGTTGSPQMRFRYMKSTSYKKNLVLYKREKTNPQYSGYITTCPVTYTITIAENAKGLVEAATTTKILKGASVKLTANAYAGYTKTGGNWIVKNTATQDVVEGLVGPTNFLTMPDYDVTIDYNFQEIKDQFVDNLHGNTTIEKGGANYELPTLSDFSETTGKPSDAFTKFIGWSATSYDSGEPATEQPTILEGSQTATGATYYAVWSNGSGKYITEYCQTAVPTNLHLVEEYHKATSVRIDWNNVTGADMYHIIVMDGGSNIIADADVTESLYDLSGLTPGATYYCTVKAHKNCWSDETELYEFTTKENIQSYAVTINAEGGTYEIDPDLDEDGKIQEGATVTISNIAVTDATIHYFKELTVPEATDLTEVDGSYMFTMPGKAVTINIVFAEFPKVTWMMEGQTYAVTSSVRQDDKFVVDAVQPAPATWTFKEYYKEFAGWMTNDDLENPVFATATTEVPADGLVVNGAVAKSGTKQYQLITDVANLAANDELVIVGLKTKGNVYYAAGDISDTHNYLDAIEIDAPENNIITIESEDVLVFTLGGTTDAWTFNANGKYLSSTGTEANKWDGDYKTWKLANSSTDNMVVMKSVKYTSGVFEFNMGSPRFRNYEGTQEDLYFYRYSGSIYENLTTDPSGVVIRSGLTNNKIGTMCQAKEIVAVKGGTLYQPNYEQDNYLEFIEVTLPVKAGMPLIYQADGTNNGNLAVIYGAEETGKALTGNQTRGMVGYIGTETMDVPNYSESNKNYVFQNNKLLRANQNYLINDRAYVSIDAVHALEPIVEEPIAAPRRRLVMDVEPHNTPTGNADVLSGTESIRKMIINDKMYILRAGKMYDATGKFVK